MLLFLFCFVCVSSGPARYSADTPRDFLAALACGSADVWLEYRNTSEDSTPADTIVVFIDGLSSLSVLPGEMVLEDTDRGYRAIFPNSRWSWRTAGGRIGSVTGKTVVEWKLGGYRWVSVPLFTQEAKTIGRRESLCTGVFITGAIMVASFIAVWYAKRRYG